MINFKSQNRNTRFATHEWHSRGVLHFIAFPLRHRQVRRIRKTSEYEYLPSPDISTVEDQILSKYVRFRQSGNSYPIVFVLALAGNFSSSNSLCDIIRFPRHHKNWVYVPTSYSSGAAIARYSDGRESRFMDDALLLPSHKKRLGVLLELAILSLDQL
jgi:hypothetical protein